MAPLAGKLTSVLDSTANFTTTWLNLGGSAQNAQSPVGGRFTLTVEGLESGGTVSIFVLNRDPQNTPAANVTGFAHPTVPTISASGAVDLGEAIFSHYRFQKVASGSPTRTTANLFGLVSR